MTRSYPTSKPILPAGISKKGMPGKSKVLVWTSIQYLVFGPFHKLLVPGFGNVDLPIDKGIGMQGRMGLDGAVGIQNTASTAELDFSFQTPSIGGNFEFCIQEMLFLV
jgi:hypothetical protein